MPPSNPSKFRSLAAWIIRYVPKIVAINLVAALAAWWFGGPLQWFAGGLAAATAIAALIVFLDFWTSRLPWRSIEQRGLSRNRDYVSRSVRYALFDETVSERTIPLGCPTLIVVIVTGFITTAAGLLAMATLILIGSWAAVLQEKELWPPVEPEKPSDST